MRQVYLDYAATTPTHPDVVKEMLPFFTESFGNPSSIHACGQANKKAVEKARASLAHLLGASEEEIVFTSGGTEADNYAIKGVAFATTSLPLPLSTMPFWRPATLLRQWDLRPPSSLWTGMAWLTRTMSAEQSRPGPSSSPS